MTITEPFKYIAYALKRDGRVSHWVEIGVASEHADGKGFDVMLDRLPIGGFNGHVSVRTADTKPPLSLYAGPERPMG